MSRPRIPGEPEPGTTGRHADSGRGRPRPVARHPARGRACPPAHHRILLLPGSGFELRPSRLPGYWAGNLADHGPSGFYDRGFFADYTPGYLYVLWLVGSSIARRRSAATRRPDQAAADPRRPRRRLAALVDGPGARRPRRRAALVGAALSSSTRSPGSTASSGARSTRSASCSCCSPCATSGSDRPERSALWAIVAAVIKPQLGILVPIVAAVVIRRYLSTREPRTPVQPAPERRRPAVPGSRRARPAAHDRARRVRHGDACSPCRSG